MGREIVYSQTRAGHFEPVMSRAVARKMERDKKQRRESILGAAIIVGAVAVYVVGLAIVASV